MQVLARVSGGDLRKAITTLQSAVRLKGAEVETQTLLDVSGAVPPALVSELLEAARSGSFERMQRLVTDAIADGWPAQEMLLEIQKAVLADEQVRAESRGKVCAALAQADKALVDGADEFLQLLHVGSVACSMLSAPA
eukprot:jgi/Botrbrau1/18574/Bobra.0367s0018.1